MFWILSVDIVVVVCCSLSWSFFFPLLLLHIKSVPTKQGGRLLLWSSHSNAAALWRTTLIVSTIKFRSWFQFFLPNNNVHLFGCTLYFSHYHECFWAFCCGCLLMCCTPSTCLCGRGQFPAWVDHIYSQCKDATRCKIPGMTGDVTRANWETQMTSQAAAVDPVAEREFLETRILFWSRAAYQQEDLVYQTVCSDLHFSRILFILMQRSDKGGDCLEESQKDWRYGLRFYFTILALNSCKRRHKVRIQTFHESPSRCSYLSIILICLLQQHLLVLGLYQCNKPD